MKEIKPLTSLRALAALLVFMYHYVYLFPPSSRDVAFAGEWIPFMPLWRQGQVGVSIFFVLSGFLITRIYFDKMAVGEASLRLFFVKRIARIWPLFLLFALVQHAAEMMGGATLQPSALVTMSMTQGFFEHLRYVGLPTAWSLTIEESFYIFAPLFFIIVAKMTSEKGRESEALTGARLLHLIVVIAAVVLGLFGIGEILVRISVGLGINWHGLMESRHHMLHATLFGRFPEFAIGAVTAFAHRGWDLDHILRGRRADIVLILLFVAIGACMWGRTLLGNSVATYALAYMLSALSGAMILALCVEHSLVHRVMSFKLFVFLGKVSYGFYLVQLTVMMTPFLILSDRLGWARVPVLLLLTNIFCAIVYKLWEVPARRYIVNRWG